MTLDTLDRELLNLIQADFPLVERPFRVLGEKLGISEAEVIRRARGLKERGMVRLIGGVFNSASLGYQSTLVAMHLPDGRLDEAAAAVSRSTAVSHNYAREHHYNLWFTLTLPEGESLEQTISGLARDAGAEDFISLPSEKLFKIDVFFDMVGKSDRPAASKRTAAISNGSLSDEDRTVIKGLQQDLPLVGEPFAQIAENLGMRQGDFLSGAGSLLERGIMRRYGASLKHREAGFAANAMSCWKVPPDQAERVGAVMASYKTVSHCYQRRTNGDRWPYSIFGMIHSHTRAGCEEVARDIAEKTGIADYLLLYSTREFKKQRVRYFSD
ncbi:MAG: AsnC family transcriptional regulator [Dehalococcoidia bacterium]|nr:AsnC family transcriptional regulator [Dehalococcoidia bacterium]